MNLCIDFNPIIKQTFRKEYKIDTEKRREIRLDNDTNMCNRGRCCVSSIKLVGNLELLRSTSFSININNSSIVEYSFLNKDRNYFPHYISFLKRHTKLPIEVCRMIKEFCTDVPEEEIHVCIPHTQSGLCCLPLPRLCFTLFSFFGDLNLTDIKDGTLNLIIDYAITENSTCVEDLNDLQSKIHYT